MQFSATISACTEYLMEKCSHLPVRKDFGTQDDQPENNEQPKKKKRSFHHHNIIFCNAQEKLQIDAKLRYST